MYDENYHFDPQVLSDNYHNESSPDSIYSVDAAIYRVISKPHQLGAIVERVVNGKVHGDADSFHTLIDICRKCGNYEDAFNLCKLALERIDNSLLLYTDIIEISAHFENPIKYCRIHLKKVLRSDRAHWNLWLFRAVYELFYTLVANNLIRGINYEHYEKAREAAIGMQNFYGVEDGYFAEARLLILIGKREEARLLLEDLIFNPYDPEKDSSRDLRCPKCCRLWITEFKDFYGDKRMIYHTVVKGFLESETEEDVAFFNRQRERLIQQLINSAKSVDEEAMFCKINAGYSIDTYNIPSHFEKEEKPKWMTR